MKKLVLILSVTLSSASTMPAQVFLNEILFEVPGADAPYEFVELRGQVGASLGGYYLLGVEGDSTSNPGDIQNIFDLTTQSLGANGFLTLAQKGNPYTINPAATALVNAGSDPGFGSGAGSSIGHSGDGGATDIENASITFMLIQIGAGSAPTLGTDLDAADSGSLSLPSGWTVVDSVGVLDGGSADISYGGITFRDITGQVPHGIGANPIDLGFTPGYVGRKEGSTGSAATDWLAAKVAGSPPSWTFSATDISDPSFAGAAVDSFGAPNPVPEIQHYGSVAAVGLLVFVGYRRRLQPRKAMVPSQA